MNPPRALVVENDPQFRRVLLRHLASCYETIEVTTAELALDLVLNGDEFDVIVCDMGLDGWSGGDLYRRLVRRRDPHASRFVMLSGLDVRARHPGLAAELGERLLEKPIGREALLSLLATVTARAAA